MLYEAIIHQCIIRTSSMKSIWLQGASHFDKKVNIQVSQVSESAKQAIESKGGNVTTVYYNDLGLRALVSPEWFEKKGRQIPKAARPHPKKRGQWDTIGSLPPSEVIEPIVL